MTTLTEFNQALGNAIRATRSKKGLSQRKVRLKARINSHRLVGEAEIGKRDIKLSTALKICVGLDEKPSNILKLVNVILTQPNWVEENRSLLVSGIKKPPTRIRLSAGEDFSDSNFSLALGVVIKEIRIVKGLSKKQLTRAVGFQSDRAVSEYEGGLRCPRITTLFRLCRGLDVNTSYVAELLRNQFTIDKGPRILMNARPSILKDHA